MSIRGSPDQIEECLKFIVWSPKARDKTPLVSLKGMAFLCAVEAGMVQKLPDGSYEEAPFLQFWSEFAKFIPANCEGYANELESIVNLLERERSIKTSVK